MPARYYWLATHFPPDTALAAVGAFWLWIILDRGRAGISLSAVKWLLCCVRVPKIVHAPTGHRNHARSESARMSSPDWVSVPRAGCGRGNFSQQPIAKMPPHLSELL